MQKFKIKEEFNNGKDDEYVKTVSILVNPEDNGGESIILAVDVFDNGDGLPQGLYTNVHLETSCYGASSSKISLYGVGFYGLLDAMKAVEKRIGEMLEN